MAKTRDERHRYGQHYTPEDVAMLLAAFAIKTEGDIVFDPSCGDGRLLQAALRLKAHLSSSGKQRNSSLGKRRGGRFDHQVFGIDRSAHAVKLAAQTGAQAFAADFFELEPGAIVCGTTRLPDEFDAIIGNPPYIRQEVMGVGDKRRVTLKLEQDSELMPEAFWPRWSGRSDAYVYFFARSIRFLKEGGRLAFLTASSWLDAGYGAALREFLLKNFRVVAVVESSAESFFDDASINTSITVLERKSDQQARDENKVRFVRLTGPLGEIICGDERKAVELARLIEQSDTSAALATHRVRAINQQRLKDEGCGWGRYLRGDDVLFRVVERGSNRLRRLSSFARVRFGVKTGANEFFYVKRATEGRLLALNDIATVRRGLTTGANQFFYLKALEGRTGKRDGVKTQSRRAAETKSESELIQVEDSSGERRVIESIFLSPVVFSLKEISGIILERKQTRRLFFNCSLAPREIRQTHALRYIKSGERAGYNRRPTCASRRHWYAVADGLKSAPLIFPSKVGERWLVALNRDGVFEDKKLYGVFPQRGVSSRLLAALLNSTWARYYAEVTCRQMTGAQAIADIDVAVAEQILLPDPREMSPTLKKKIEAALIEITRRPVVSIFEEINRADRRQLDELVLAAIGFRNSQERKRTLNELYEAVTRLVRARIDKAR